MYLACSMWLQMSPSSFYRIARGPIRKTRISDTCRTLPFSPFSIPTSQRQISREFRASPASMTPPRHPSRLWRRSVSLSMFFVGKMHQNYHVRTTSSCMLVLEINVFLRTNQNGRSLEGAGQQTEHFVHMPFFILHGQAPSLQF